MGEFDEPVPALDLSGEPVLILAIGVSGNVALATVTRAGQDGLLEVVDVTTLRVEWRYDQKAGWFKPVKW